MGIVPKAEMLWLASACIESSSYESAGDEILVVKIISVKQARLGCLFAVQIDTYRGEFFPQRPIGILRQGL